eukprot:1492486-Prymnesium_polylepis.1
MKSLSVKLELRTGSIHSEADLSDIRRQTTGLANPSTILCDVMDDVVEDAEAPAPPPKPCVDVVLVDSMIALALCGQLGVLCRWGLGKLADFGELCYGTGCPTVGAWAPNPWVAAFPVLPANMVGCFIMGFLSDGK